MVLCSCRRFAFRIVKCKSLVFEYPAFAAVGSIAEAPQKAGTFELGGL